VILGYTIFFSTFAKIFYW